MVNGFSTTLNNKPQNMTISQITSVPYKNVNKG